MKKYVALGLALLFPCLHGVAHADLPRFHRLPPIGQLPGGHGNHPMPAAPFPGGNMGHPNPMPPMPPQIAQGPRMAQGPRISLGEASRIVQQATGGRILEAHPQNVGGHVMYRVKVLTNNEVRIVMVDAETGAME